MNRIVFPLKPRMQGLTVADLQDALVLLLDRKLLLGTEEAASRELTVALKQEREKQAFAGATSKAVSRFQQERGMQPTGEVDEPTATKLNAVLEDLGAFKPAVTYRVEGRVVSRTSAAISGLRVVIVDKGMGGDETLAEATTDAQGAYRATFSGDLLTRRGKQEPDLQAQVRDGRRPIASSGTRYNASALERELNVVLDEKVSSTLQSEHETLLASLEMHFNGKLAELKEDDVRQDVTYLANKSGWDARAVALAALADQFTGRASAGGAPIEAPFFYALFRAGLPANDEALYRADAKTVEGVWKQAFTQGVVPSVLQQRVPAALESFRKLGAKQLLDGAPLAGLSSFKSIVALSLGDSAEKQEKVADLHSQHAGDPAAFRKAVQDAFGEATAKRLVLDGQLAYLTLNNAPLIGKVHATSGGAGITDSAQLVAKGFYRGDTWRRLVGADPIPPEIRGKSDDERRERYAELLAAQVRLSFPTAALAQMVKAGETPVGSARMRDEVHAFLNLHEGKFEIGMQSVGQYIARNDVQVDPAVKREVARIQRVYQITPDDRSMNGLLMKGIDSAQAVARYGREEFVRAFKNDVGSEEAARLVHAKAEQVHGAVLNVALTFLTAKGAPGIGVHSPASIIDPSPKPPANASDVIAYATLESLFGEMDYCACDHCRSILSPAAYLVDLLQFTDRPASEIPGGFTNPQIVLLDRRPDIQHLPLTCENTSTPLPYIDLVNETLEYYVVNGLTLANYTGHSTDDSSPREELLASPQFVTEAAYTALAGAAFPPPLPFDQPLEGLRRYFTRFEAPLARVMEALRANDSLERATESDYGWRDIWMETLGLSRAEHVLLTERTTVGGTTDVMGTVKRLFGFDPATPDSDARAVLDNAKLLSRRMGVTYEELVELLKARFVNPNSDLIPRLQRLGVSFADLQAYKDGTISDAEFDELLAPGLDSSKYGGDVKAWVKDDDNHRRIMSLITLTNPADPEDVCNFDKVELRYANPDAAANRLRAFEYVRLLRLVRLWRRLGWSIAETDSALTTLYPDAQLPNDPSDAVNLERLDAGFLILLPRLGVTLRLMGDLDLSPKKDLLSLLGCFAPIDAHGENSLYRRMFLRLQQVDAAFADDGYGSHLTDAGAKLLDHEETLRAAFTLTSGEFAEVAAALEYNADTVLSLDTISAIFRRGWLARKLKLSVREFLLIIRSIGLDPFELPNPVAPAALSFIDLVTRLRKLGVKPAHALYLIWNHDLTGKASPSPETVVSFARTLRRTMAEIESEFSVVDDPDGSIARSRVALVYGGDATDFFFGLLEGALATTVAYDHTQTILEQPVVDAAKGLLAYDDFRKELSYRGLLTVAGRDAIKNVAGVQQPLKDAVDSIFTANQKAVDPFFSRYPELRAPYGAWVVSSDPIERKRATLLEAIVPELKSRRKRQQALQAIGTFAATEPGFASAVMEDAAVLHAVNDAAKPALEDLVAVATAGLAASFFYSGNAIGNADLRRDTEAYLDYSDTGSTKLPPNVGNPDTPIAGVWSGYLEAPENGFYNFRITTETAASVAVALNGAPVALSRANGTWENTEPISLKAGAMYAVSITVETVRSTLAMKWQTKGRGWEIVPPQHLFSASLAERLRLTSARFLKAASLALALKLTAAEVAHFATRVAYRVNGDGWLNHLPVVGEATAGTARSLLKPLKAMLSFSSIKAGLSPDDERLLDVLRSPGESIADANGLLFTLTHWDKASLDALLARFGLAGSDLAEIEQLHRVVAGQEWSVKLGVGAVALSEATTNQPSAAVVQRLQSALRARFDEEAWLDILKPINDDMRSRQRDALVAHILHQMRANAASSHIDTPDKLFEYFLMDVQMDPCMLTSRVRNALSSVQLFIERCLMNLEPRVAPSSLNSRHWAWMKRYRVWEANRKVFLWPENWLEPELRDDQSPFFKDLMSNLLQGDITEDRAAAAYVDYLVKLEEVAKLEICGVHYEENSEGRADDVVHVIARTSGARRTYYYRRRTPSGWTPWTKVGLDIEDNPVIPVVWRNRLFLFWLKFVQETLPAPNPSPPDGTSLSDVPARSMLPTGAPTVVVKAILSWSEYVGGKWQPTRTSDPARPLELQSTALESVNDFRADLRLAALFWPNAGIPDGSLRIIVSYKGLQGSSFLLYNPFSTPERRTGKKEPHFSPKRGLDTADAPFKITYLDSGSAHAVVSNSIEDRTMDPRHPMLGNAWDAPFFYEDSRHVFYVTTTERQVAIPQWSDIGVIVKPPKVMFEIPSLVFKRDPTKQPLAASAQPRFGAIDPSPIERFVTEDVHIKRALGTPGTVTFGERAIGPTGSQIDLNRGK